MIRDDQQIPEKSGGSTEPVTLSLDIVAAINAVGERYEAVQQGRTEHDRQTLKWTKRAGIGVAVYTALTLAIVVLAYCTFRTAQDQVAVSRDTERRQLRAYIIHSPTLECIVLTAEIRL
jgi:hypothetical protein